MAIHNFLGRMTMQSVNTVNLYSRTLVFRKGYLLQVTPGESSYLSLKYWAHEGLREFSYIASTSVGLAWECLPLRYIFESRQWNDVFLLQIPQQVRSVEYARNAGNSNLDVNFL